MFYHFKGTITGEDYQRILGQMTKRMMLVFSGIMLIFLVINLFMSKGQWLWPGCFCFTCSCFRKSFFTLAIEKSFFEKF